MNKATSISLHPLDVGFDLRATKTPVKLTDNADLLEIKINQGNKCGTILLTGTAKELAPKLRARGFRVTLTK